MMRISRIWFLAATVQVMQTRPGDVRKTLCSKADDWNSTIEARRGKLQIESATYSKDGLDSSLGDCMGNFILTQLESLNLTLVEMSLPCDTTSGQTSGNTSGETTSGETTSREKTSGGSVDDLEQPRNLENFIKISAETHHLNVNGKKWCGNISEPITVPDVGLSPPGRNNIEPAMGTSNGRRVLGTGASDERRAPEMGAGDRRQAPATGASEG